ncbi:MAG TPA: hypothetical protein VM779_10745, partial [Thermoanaerobaculia bacterium]|nr:hypothetical protein [Thermoanaerobaculia bacterium]
GFLAEGERIDGRADLFSLAMVLYEMLTGRPPFEATSPHEYVMLHSREQQFKPLDLPPDLPGGAQLQAVLAKALDRDRTRRYASAREFAAALQEVQRSLPDENVMKTMHLQPMDAGATWIPTPLPEIDTLHRDTVRTQNDEAPPTIRTPLPPLGAAPPTEHAAVVPRARHGSIAAFAIIGLILLAALAAIAFLFLRRQEPVTAVAETTAPTAVSRPQAEPSAANVDVVTTTSPAATATEPTLSTTTAPVIIEPDRAPAPVPQPGRQTTPPTPAPQPAPQPVPQPVPQPPAQRVRPFIDGDLGDADVNDQLIENVRRQLAGVRTVAVRGSGPMYDDLVRRIRNDHGLTVSDSAEVLITFDGALEQLGRGRKRRQADATISRSGRVIFVYQLPSEIYRVGDTPAEAFSRVIGDAFAH